LLEIEKICEMLGVMARGRKNFAGFLLRKTGKNNVQNSRGRQSFRKKLKRSYEKISEK